MLGKYMGITDYDVWFIFSFIDKQYFTQELWLDEVHPSKSDVSMQKAHVHEVVACNDKYDRNDYELNHENHDDNINNSDHSEDESSSSSSSGTDDDNYSNVKGKREHFFGLFFCASEHYDNNLSASQSNTSNGPTSHAERLKNFHERRKELPRRWMVKNKERLERKLGLKGLS